MGWFGLDPISSFYNLPQERMSQRMLLENFTIMCSTVAQLLLAISSCHELEAVEVTSSYNDNPLATPEVCNKSNMV